jgi:serine/threonine protein kinase/tetratricopeptide (TPR) repeat protein
MNELDLFAAAIDVADPAERAALLERECAGQPELRERIEQLLDAHLKPNPVLDVAEAQHTDALAVPDPATESIRTATEAVGTVVAGRYKLLQQIGEGGMGSVWMADQTEPVKRRVAVKLIRVERGQSRMLLSRFEAERQAIALMDHPNIARLLDAGTTAEGAPFFVMELVKGIPLNEYCDGHKLSIRDRLQLFMQVCSAVQHAHQKGVIHRDLKPSNILVESHDGKAVPKVIDFGLAKATTGLQLSEHTLFTAFGSVIGTPLYMAPEQATFNAVDVDTRADVYTLGVILYELLTGTTPVTRESMKKAAIDEMLKLIREQDAPTPSSRLSTTESIPSIAANRQTEPQKLSRFLKGELDWIVMKALSKERDRRYETASGLARDIERFLNHEAVAAGPPSPAYKLRKFSRRNRVPVIAASLVFLALLAGVVGTTLGLLEARRQAEFARRKEWEATEEKGRALRAVQEERKAKLEALEKRKEAERNLAFATKGNEILGSVFASLDPKKIAESGRPLQDVLRQNLSKAVKELEGAAIGDSLEVAAMQNTLGLSLLGLGEAPLATQVFQKALETRKPRLGGNHTDTLACMNNLALAYEESGQIPKAVSLFEETLERQKASFAPGHLDTLKTMNNLAIAYWQSGQLAKAVPLLEGTLSHRKAKLGRLHPDTLANTVNLAVVYESSGEGTKAVALYEEALGAMKAKLGPDHPGTLTTMCNLGQSYEKIGQFAKSVRILEEALTKQKSTLGPDHPSTLVTMNNLAMAYKSDGQIAAAVRVSEETLEKMKTKLGPDHPNTLGTTVNVADAYVASGQLVRAVPLLEDTLEKIKSKLGPDHPHTLITMNSLATAYRDSGQLAKALPLLEETLQKRKVTLGPDHRETLTSMNNLAWVYRKSGQLAKALPLFEETLQKQKARLGPDHPYTLVTMNNLADAYREIGQLAKAVSLLEETLDKRKTKLGPDHPETLTTIDNLGKAYTEAKQCDKAAALLIAVVDASRKRMPKDSPHFAGLLAQVSGQLLDCGEHAAALPLLRECLAIREKTALDDWRTSNTQSMLGAALLTERKYAEAEPLLVKGYEGMKAREKTIPQSGGGELRIPEALDRLITLYSAIGKPDEAKKYQELRARYPATKPADRK